MFVPLAIVLLTWTLRLCCLDTVPPGWRDDELINIHALSGRVLGGQFPLYFTGASGHEPLYHYLHAGVHAVLGFNVLSAHILSAALGTLTVALTYTLARRLYGEAVAIVASLGLSFSFWLLMYSRIGLRHINLPPLALSAFILLWVPLLPGRRSLLRWAVPLGVALAMSIYTYPAARLLPFLVIVFGIYLAVFHPRLFRASWRGYGLALVVMVVLLVPLVIAIGQGRSDAAAMGIGADARLVELARPVWALREGDPGPLIESTWITLNMFHATGDPESLYNLPGRPVFNLLGGILVWAGVALCLFRWRRPRAFFLLLWFGTGLLPTVLSIPPASLSHSILVLPLAYILPALVLVEGITWLRRRLDRRRAVVGIVGGMALVVFLVSNAYRDFRDYFIVWPRDSLVRFLYRADYREMAGYLNHRAGEGDWAVGSLLMGPWDRVALQVDVCRDDVAVRLFDPRRALVYTAHDSPSALLLPSYPYPAPTVERILQESVEVSNYPSPFLTHYQVEYRPLLEQAEGVGRFANGLELVGAVWEDGAAPAPGREALLVTHWRVTGPLQLPPMPLVANPPPPGVYSGSRLSVFTHLLAPDGTFLAGDDGLWVDPLTLQTGDRFVQIHHFVLSSDAPSGPYTLALGLYDPLDGERWMVVDEEGKPVTDRLVLFSE
jgi:4-amino-4-deoxy-L-arabinose transferase-like glycosyltransferase